MKKSVIGVGIGLLPLSVQGSDEPIFTVGDLRVNLAHRQILVGEEEVHSMPIEYQLLLMFIQYAGKVVTRRQLRHKLEANPTRPR